jgi:hypothetical protein
MSGAASAPSMPIYAFSVHVSKDLWRYGEVRGMRSTQDEVNFRLSKKMRLPRYPATLLCAGLV